MRGDARDEGKLVVSMRPMRKVFCSGALKIDCVQSIDCSEWQGQTTTTAVTTRSVKDAILPVWDDYGVENGITARTGSRNPLL